MTTLNLQGLWIAPASDLSDTLVLRARELSEVSQVHADARQYASGRVRLITRPGRSTTIPVVATFVERDDFLELKERQGTVQLFRDSRGRRVWGVISNVTGVEMRGRPDRLISVTFAVTEITFSEVV